MFYQLHPSYPPEAERHECFLLSRDALSVGHPIFQFCGDKPTPLSHDHHSIIHFYKEKVEMPKKQRGGTCGTMCPMQGGYTSTHTMSSPRERGVGTLASPRGYYRPTARNRYFLKRYKQGKSIGFTMRSSLKAKGLIPRANGTKRVSAKYRD